MTANNTTENTGNYPVAVTAVALYEITTITTPGYTITTAAEHQDVTTHTPAQNLTFDKPAV